MKITRSQNLEVKKIAQKFQLKLVIVFGSFASGQNKEDSDLDIGVLGGEAACFEKQVDLANELSKVFRKNVDLSVFNRSNPLLLFQASQNSFLLYGRGQEFNRFKFRAFKEYHDYAPYFAMERKLNKKLISAYAS